MARGVKSTVKSNSSSVKSPRSKVKTEVVSNKSNSSNKTKKTKKTADKLGISKTSKVIKKSKQDKIDENAMDMFRDLQKKIEQMEKKIKVAEKKEKSLAKIVEMSSPKRGNKRKAISNTENPDSRDNLKKSDRSIIKSSKSSNKLKSTKTGTKKTTEVEESPRSRHVSAGTSQRRRLMNRRQSRRDATQDNEVVGRLPDMDDERHRCSIRCPPSCQGHLRPNEIIIYESSQFNLRLLTGQLKINKTKPPPGSRKKTTRPTGPSRSPPTPARLQLLLDQPPADIETAENHGWNSNDRSFNIRLLEEDPLVMRRRPVAQSTDCVRAKVGYTSGLHLFSILWPYKMRGTHAVVGVSTRDQPLHAVGYQSLVGSTTESWGWDLGRLKAYHNSRHVDGVRYPADSRAGDPLPDLFYMVIDMDAGTLAFYADGRYLGVSHSGLQGHKVFPCISTVWGNCEVKLTYMGGLEAGAPMSLQQLARGEVRRCLRQDLSLLPQLQLPNQIERYISFL